jgi:hypothetical protein
MAEVVLAAHRQRTSVRWKIHNASPGCRPLPRVRGRSGGRDLGSRRGHPRGVACWVILPESPAAATTWWWRVTPRRMGWQMAGAGRRPGGHLDEGVYNRPRVLPGAPLSQVAARRANRGPRRGHQGRRRHRVVAPSHDKAGRASPSWRCGRLSDYIDRLSRGHLSPFHRGVPSAGGLLDGTTVGALLNVAFRPGRGAQPGRHDAHPPG